jgi:hypothetical protein
LVVSIVLVAGGAILALALRSRRANITVSREPTVDFPVAAAVAPSSKAESKKAPEASPAPLPKTQACVPIVKAWISWGEGKRVWLQAGENLIGREPTCGILLERLGVSAKHARIVLEQMQGMIWVEDLGSRNGTFWGQARTDPSQLQRLTSIKHLQNGDQIWAGGEKMIVNYER